MTRRSFLQLLLLLPAAWLAPKIKPAPRATAIEVGCLPACMPFWLGCNQPATTSDQDRRVYLPMVK